MTTDNPFDGCEFDEILALVFDLAGLEGLEQLLAVSELDRDALSAAENNLRAAGLLEAADHVAGAAARAADPVASEITAILSDPIPGNRRALLAQAYRHSRIDLKRLELAGIDPNTLAYVAQSMNKRRDQ